MAELVSQDKQDPSDRRREQRVEVCLDAWWNGRSGRVSARIIDLSEGGCYVDTLGEAYIGEILNIRLPLPDGDMLELSGEVAHHSSPIGFGLRFVNFSEQQREKLESLLASLKDAAGDSSAVLSRKK
jgi:hypothetical protein